jgi:LacI family transcriptional regulator
MAVSVKDVAAAASVSVGTVSNVLNQPSKVAASTVERVMSAIAELGYVRNDAARQLRAGRSRCIGLVVLDVGNPFFAEVARGAEARAAEEGMTVLLGSSDERLDRESNYLDLFQEQRVNGVLVTPATDDLTPLARLRDAGVPVVLVDRETTGGEYMSVAVDDIEGGQLAVAHLLERGRRRIAFIGGPLATRQVADRLEGARRAVAAVEGASLEVIETPALTVLQGRAAGEALVARDAAARPDAVFAANDLLAVGLLQGLSLMADLRVPDDIALIGYDDIDFASATVVPLSSIRQPASLIGYTAVDVLLAELGEGTGHERNVRFQPELVVRASTGG